MTYEYLAIGGVGLSVILAAALGWLWLRVMRLDRVRKQFLIDDESKQIDDTLVTHDQEINRITNQLNALEESVGGLAMANKKNYQKIGFVRFNPFGDAGGSISFVLALLDSDDNGVVISSLHGREGNRTYAKEVKNGGSKSQLTEEEQQAIKEAK